MSRIDNDRLKIIADALEDAGVPVKQRRIKNCDCNNYSFVSIPNPLLDELRSNHERYPGYFVLDVLLGVNEYE